MEGVAGVATLDQVIRGGVGYPAAQRLMTAEANAAIRGAFAAGATQVRVTDSHGTMDNLLPDLLDPRARLVNGGPRAATMVHGLQHEDDAAVFVGYHAPAGAAGVLAHSFSSNFTELRVNGRAVSEAEVNALYAASFGVPIAVLTGDDEICRLVRERMPGVATVPVKTGHGFQAADSLSPSGAAEAIERAVTEALSVGRWPAVPDVDGPFRLAADFAVPLYADLAAMVPGSVRSAGRTLERDVANAAELVQLIMAWYYLSSVGASQFAAIAHRR